MRFATLLLFLIGIMVPPRARGQLHLPGMVQVDDSTYIDVKEVSVKEWATYAMMVDGAQRPDEAVLSMLPYRYLFNSDPSRTTRTVKGWSRYGWQVRFEVDKDSLRTRLLRYQTEQYLNYPIAGITSDQAQGYCAWLTKLNEERHTWDEGQGEWEVVYAMPSPDHYDRLLSMADSSNGTCATFNYACEPCQPKTDGREAFIHPGREVTPVYGYGPDRRGLYNLRGNVAEMTSVPGVAKGGSYAHPAKDALPGVVQRYEAPQLWLGFRCIARVRRR
jgi:formylglycine-generating enzyme required for sulfatase activity